MLLLLLLLPLMVQHHCGVRGYHTRKGYQKRAVALRFQGYSGSSFWIKDLLQLCLQNTPRGHWFDCWFLSRLLYLRLSIVYHRSCLCLFSSQFCIWKGQSQTRHSHGQIFVLRRWCWVGMFWKFLVHNQSCSSKPMGMSDEQLLNLKEVKWGWRTCRIPGQYLCGVLHNGSIRA